MEALGDAVAGDLNAVGVLSLESAILEGGVEEINDGERQALARVGGLEGLFVSGIVWRWRFAEGCTVPCSKFDRVMRGERG